MSALKDLTKDARYTCHILFLSVVVAAWLCEVHNYCGSISVAIQSCYLP